MLCINTIPPSPSAHSFSLGCSKAQADAKQAGYVATISIEAEERYVNMSKYTQAYQEYLVTNAFVNKWKKIVSKSPKCFKKELNVIEPIFRKFYSKATMCERYGNSVCRTYPSKLSPRRPTTLADICGKNPYSSSYIDCVERLSEPDGSNYVD